MNGEHYCQLAELIDFPETENIARGNSLLVQLQNNYPQAADELEHFLKGIPEKTLNLQELYTRTFDVQAITTLDIGYVLFGDDYKRAELLSNLTREHIQAENNCKTELADNLANVLRLIPKMKDPEIVAELVTEIIVPALMLMIREFDSERIIKKNVNYQTHYKTLIDLAPKCEPTIYCHLLKAVLGLLKEDFQVTEIMTKILEWSDPRNAADFLCQIGKEMEIENNANPTNSGCDA